MTGDPERDPDRPPPARPVRVARLDDLDDRDRPGTAVAGFDGLGAAPPVAGPVARLDALDALDTRDRRTGEPRTDRRAATRPDRRDQADRQESPRAEPERPAARRRPPPVVERGPAADDPSQGPLEDDGIPPDRPLPRGRRRGARAGRLGPDAPDPDRAEAEPEPPADPVAVAREICLRLLADRARTRQELAQALARKGVPADAAATVLDRFDEVGLIDDVAFAAQWVRSRHAYRGLGRRAIAVELRRKGVADDIAGEALAEVDAESEDRRARELVDRKLRSLTLDTAEQRASAARRLVGMLARKGYGAGIAYRVVRETLAERGAELDELAAEHDG